MDKRLPEVPYRPTVPALLARAVTLYGDNDFVVTADRRIGFRDAELESRRVAKLLLVSGAGKGTRIGIVLPTGIEWVVVWLAAARIGALSMLLPATYRPAELRRALAIGDVAHLFAPRTLFGRDYEAFLEEAVPGLTQHGCGPLFTPSAPYLRFIWLPEPNRRPWAASAEGDGAGVDDGILAAIEEAVTPADPLLVIFTSGSSADPKAIVHIHGTAVRKIQPELGMCLPASFPGRTFCAMPFFWVGGPQELLGALHSGAAVITQPRFEPREALELLERERCTSFVGWANIMDRLASDPTFDARDLAALVIPPRPLSSRGDPRNLGMTETFGPHGNREWFEYKVTDPETGEELVDGEEG
jgi:acyl-CoA synthetase (AMP-forming)/AMP-acid ligase II